MYGPMTRAVVPAGEKPGSCSGGKAGKKCTYAKREVFDGPFRQKGQGVSKERPSSLRCFREVLLSTMTSSAGTWAQGHLDFKPHSEDRDGFQPEKHHNILIKKKLGPQIHLPDEEIRS